MSIRSYINRALYPVLKVFGLNKVMFRALDWLKNGHKKAVFRKQLNCVLDNHSSKAYNLPLFMCQRNELHRLPFFLNYYRNLGIDHFFIIDNDSDDGSIEFLKRQDDVSIWYTKASYKESNFGMYWCNFLLTKYGTGKWCVTCDPDEFLVYPNIETRNLNELTNWMDSIKQNSLFCVMLDCYSDTDIDKTYIKDGNVFRSCQYFDRFNFTQRYNAKLGNVWVQGGVRMRKHFKLNPSKAPAQNKVPLIKWEKSYEYLSSMHHTNTPSLNCSVYKDNRYVSGAIFHFKYVSEFKTKVEEEMKRKEHYDGGIEYKSYHEKGYESLYDPFWSLQYKDSQQLLELKYIHNGEWF